ncbi:low molecular weight protein tyrosine phosphatase family protein [Microbacterium sp. NPDC090218]
MHVLFVCSRNRLRSPTAENVFRDWPGIQVASAGLKPDANEVLTREDLEWADLVLVMEAKHKSEISRRFMPHLRDTRLAVLGIPDDYGFMDPDLIELLLRRVAPYLPARQDLI